MLRILFKKTQESLNIQWLVGLVPFQKEDLSAKIQITC